VDSILKKLLEELEKNPDEARKLAEKLISLFLVHEINQMREELTKAVTSLNEATRNTQAELVKLREDFNKALIEVGRRFEMHDRKFDEIVNNGDSGSKSMIGNLTRLSSGSKSMIGNL
jgi:hypothetical protein